MSQTQKWITAAMCWTVALTAMIAVNLSDLGAVAGQWSLLFALAGSVLLVWALLVEERLKIERLAQIMANAMVADEHVSHIN